MPTSKLDSKTRIEIWNTLKSIDNVPTMPSVYFKLDKLLSDPNASIVSVRRAIEEDPPIVAKILQRVNSGFYNLSREVNNIQQAIVMLGLTEIYNLVVELSILSMFQNMKESPYFSFDKFWKHSSGTARTAAAIRKHIGVSFDNVEFTSGLLHDFGRLILCIFFNELYQKVFEYSENNQASLYDAEMEQLNFTHTEAGYWLAKRWHLPTEVSDVMLHHHDVTPKDVREHPLRAIVYLADKITNLWGFSLHPVPNFDAIEDDPIWLEVVKVYPRMATFPLDDMINILNMPIEEADTYLYQEESERNTGKVQLASLKDIVENLINGFAELQHNLEEKQISWIDAFVKMRMALQSNIRMDLLSIYRWNAESFKLEPIFTHGDPTSALDMINFRRGKGAVRWIMQNKKPLLISNAERNSKITEKVVNSFLGVPIVTGNSFSGVMVVGCFQDGQYGDNEQYFLEVASEYVGRLFRFVE